MTSLISEYSAGVLTIFMAIFHTRFYNLFAWEIDYKKLTELNQKILYTIHIALYLLFFGMGLLTIVYARELSGSTGIGFGINLVLMIFWLWRTIWQIVYFKGRVLHYIMIFYFLLLFVTYLIPLIINIA
jgi:hypothetical protein